MIVLDEPYVSEPLIAWLVESQHAVLDNAMAQRIVGQGHALDLVDAAQAAERINAGERVYTNSENALAWIVENTANPSLTHAIALFKDKAAMRRALAALDPDLFFKTCSIDELFKLDFSRLETPFVLKPSVGFCSVGVYAVRDREDWERALADIRSNASSWHDRYPESVIGAGSFILEGYLDGTEYALDAYFDEQGQAHILNVLRHDFSSPEDTSDRMYVTSAAIVRENTPALTAWLDQVNALVGARNFPVHVEVRVQDGRVRPIEFNPLRFAGLGGTDVSYYGYGYRTYEAFLTDQQPDFDAAFAGKDGKVYTMSLLNAPADATGDERFDYDALRARFTKVLELRPFEVRRTGTYGFLFLETDADSADELHYLQNTDLKEFLR
ncbi:MAG: ATP-grasp domain-containing protein [Gordonibacter sp.]